MHICKGSASSRLWQISPRPHIIKRQNGDHHMLTAAGFEKALAYWPMFLQGVVCTVALSALTVVFGFILALLLAVMRLSNIYPFRSLGLTKDGRLRERRIPAAAQPLQPLRFVSTVYVELFRATPMVVQIFLIFYVVFADIKVLPGFKLFGFIRFDRFFPAVVALALNSGAYLSEIPSAPASSPSTAVRRKQPVLWVSVRCRICASWCCLRPSRTFSPLLPTNSSPSSRSPLSATPSACRTSCPW